MACHSVMQSGYFSARGGGGGGGGGASVRVAVGVWAVKVYSSLCYVLLSIETLTNS